VAGGYTRRPVTPSEVLLDLSRVMIGLGLAVFVGPDLAALLGRGGGPDPAPPRDGSPPHPKGAEDAGAGRARFVAAGALLVGILLETQVLGSSLPRRHVARAVLLFLLVASLVYAVMVVLPKARYYEDRSRSVDESSRMPWQKRRDAALRKAEGVRILGLVLALVSLVLG